LLQDFGAGRPLEDEALNGIAVKKGAELGIPTLYNFSLYALLPQVKPRA
jgi:ketopantoate reductase